MEPRTTTVRKGNGKSPEENRLYQQLRSAGQSRQQQMQRVQDMRDGQRRKSLERVLARDPGLSGCELERAIDEDRRLQLVRARAVALTARRKAAQAAERAMAAEAALAEAIAADSSVA